MPSSSEDLGPFLGFAFGCRALKKSEKFHVRDSGSAAPNQHGSATRHQGTKEYNVLFTNESPLGLEGGRRESTLLQQPTTRSGENMNEGDV